MNKDYLHTFLTRFLLFLCSTALFSLSTHASFLKQTGRNQFIPASQAFVFDFKQQGSWLHLSWQIQPGYYLYRQQIKIVPQQAILGNFTLPAGLNHTDEFYGDITIFKQQLAVQIPLVQVKNNASIRVTYQGCAEAGFCYPPETQTVPLTVNTGNQPVNMGMNTPVSVDVGAIEHPAFSPTPLPFSPLWALLTGILISFTPCVLPMYPLISAIILGRKKNHNYKQNLLIAMSYVQGMALTYTLLGFAIAAAGLQFQATLQHPYVLTGISLVFVCLALSMFGLYSLQLPASLQTRLVTWSNHQQAGSLTGVFIMGALAGLICSPCTSAPLSAILLYIAQNGNILAGGVTLYLYAFGMGIPLIIITLFGSRLLPRHGSWMQHVKEALGFVMLTLPLFLLERILNESWIPVLWSLLGTAFFTWTFVLSLKVKQGSIPVLQTLLLTAALITAHPLQDWVWRTSTQQAHVNRLNFNPIDNLTQLNRELVKAKGQYVMLDFYADWCTACKEFEKYTFSATKVQHQLQGTLLLQANITANTHEQIALLKHFKILGLPAILFFDLEGNEISQARVSGFMDTDTFLAHLRQTMR